MKKTRRSLIAALACALVLVLSLGIVSACGTGESASAGGAWYYGAAVPAGELGQEGDYYLNTKTLASYKKTANGWTAAIDAGEVGSWFYGNGAPDGGTGAVNDFYLDTESGNLYHKDVSGWGEPVLKLFGKDGRDGVLWYSGTQEDPNTYGPEDTTLNGCIAGDFYLDAVNFEVWQLGTDGTWIDLGSLTGAQGVTGPEGPRGDQGPKGDDGKSAYELYVEQYKTEHGGEDGMLSEKDWLDSLKGDKGDKGDPGKDSVHFYNGDGAPEDNADLKEVELQEGDLYVGQFDGTDGKGSGSRLYRYIGGHWVVIMESMTLPGTISIYTLEKLMEFSQLVAEGKIAAGSEVHLKANIDFSDVEGASYSMRRAAARAVEWTPIGSAAHPFTGTFDGEGHTISGLTVSGTSAGLFAATKDATIKNLTIVDATVEAENNGKAGILVADAKGTLELKNVNVENSTVKAADGASGTTVGALVGSAAETVTAGGVTVELTDESSSEIAEENKIVGEGEVEYSKEEGASGFKTEVEQGFDKLVDLANGNKETYEITSPEGFKAFCDQVNGGDNFEGKTVYLATGIDLTKVAEGIWTPIGQDGASFSGTFDGQGNVISNLTITDGTENAGLFSKLGSGAEIKNLTLDTVNITGTTKIGGFAGSSEGACTFTNCSVTNANLTGQNEIGSFIGSCNSVTVNTSSLEKVHITVDWETESHGDTVDVGAYIGKDAEPTVDETSKAFESEVTFEYKGIMAKVGSKVYANVQDAFYAVYDMGADADDHGDIVIELLADVTVDKAMIQKNAFKSGSMTYYAWIDAFGRSNGYGVNGNHTGSNSKEINNSWPSFTFNGNNHTITIADKALTSNYNEYLIYTGGNSDWTITFENLNIKGNAAKCTAIFVEMPNIQDNFMPEIVFKNVDVTGEWNAILYMSTKSIVTLDGCNFTDTLNEKPYSNQRPNENYAFAVRMSYSGYGCSIYLKNGSYISSISCGYSSSYNGYSRVYVDATSSMDYEWISATFAVNKLVVNGAFIFDGAVPEALQLTDANKFEFTYAQAQTYSSKPSPQDKVFSTRIQDGQSETQWFLDPADAATQNALLA